MSIVKNIVNNTLAQGFGKILTAIVSAFGVTALLTRLLPQSDYGSYVFITSFVLLFGTTSDWGTNIIAVREASQNKNKQSVIFGSTILFRLLLSVVSLVVLNLVVRLNPDWSNLIQPLTIGSFVLIALSFKTSMSIIFQSLLRLDLTALSDFLSAFIFLVLVFVSSYSKLSLDVIMVDWVIATIVSSIIAYFLARSISPISWTIDFNIIKKVFLEAAPTGALLLVFTLYNRIDIIILDYFKGSEVVATYGLAYKLHDNFVLGSAFLMNALFPYLSKAFSQNGSINMVREYYQKAFDILLISSTLLLITMLIFSPLLINIIAGDKYLPSIQLLRILSFGTFIAYFNHLTGYSLIAFGKQKWSLVIALVALIFNVVGNILLVPVYSSVASAWMTVATEGLVLLISTFVIKQTTGVSVSLFLFPKTVRDLLKIYK